VALSQLAHCAGGRASAYCRFRIGNQSRL